MSASSTSLSGGKDRNESSIKTTKETATIITMSTAGMPSTIEVFVSSTIDENNELDNNDDWIPMDQDNNGQVDDPSAVDLAPVQPVLVSKVMLPLLTHFGWVHLDHFCLGRVC